jgi:nicotinate phosphoribosyltransferase
LLQEVMRNGRRIAPLPPLARVRDYCRGELQALSPPLRELREGPQAYAASISDALRELADTLDSAQARSS